MIKQLAAEDGVEVDHTEDESVYTPENLARYAAIVWLQVSGDVLTDDGRAAFETYLKSGGGWAGIHGPADAEWSWPTYEDIVGARFLYHPTNGSQIASVSPDASDPSTSFLPRPWLWEEEWYAFKRNPRGPFTVLLTIDESSYDPEEQPMGSDHPVAWRGTFGRGKTWYTSLGHHEESYREENFRNHVRSGINSVLR